MIDLNAANEIPGSFFAADIVEKSLIHLTGIICFALAKILLWINYFAMAKLFYTMPLCKIASSNFLSEKFSIAIGVKLLIVFNQLLLR